MRPLLVVALNPAVDAEWRVGRIQWEEKNTLESERMWPGGKGVNVARWLKHFGGEARLLIPLGGAAGIEFARQLRGSGISFRKVTIAQTTRTNIIVTQARGPQLRFNPKGPRLSAKEWHDTLRGFERESRRSEVIILSGSLPRGAVPGTYATLVKRGQRDGRKCLLDCDGPALAAGLRARPFLVKPNEYELAQWHGGGVGSQTALERAATKMSAVTGGWVLVSRGAKGGLLLNQALRCGWQARVPRVRVKNSVGAGDALLAAVARQINDGALPEDWLRHGLAAGTAATQCNAGEMPPMKLIRRMAGGIELQPVKVT